MENLQIDFIGNGQAEGEFAGRLLADGRLDAGSMRPFIDSKGRPCMTVYKGFGDPKKPENYVTKLVTNATLRRDEWNQLDEVLKTIAEHRLGGVQDLVEKGLVFNLGNAMGTTVLEWHDVGDAMEADLTMDGVTRSDGDRPNFHANYLPIPIIHVDYEINLRVLSASRALGNGLDTTSVERAVRKIHDRLERMLFTNTQYRFGNGNIFSYVNFPTRIPYVLPLAWDNAAKTPLQILQDVIAMKQLSINQFHFGPWMLYIPTAYETVLDRDYDNTRGNTIRDRILAINNIMGVKVVDVLAPNNLLLVQMTPDVVRLVKGMGVQNVQWSTEGNFINKYKVMTIQVPQIRADQNGRTGIVHGA
jgi:hypothetical protein